MRDAVHAACAPLGRQHDGPSIEITVFLGHTKFPVHVKRSDTGRVTTYMVSARTTVRQLKDEIYTHEGLSPGRSVERQRLILKFKGEKLSNYGLATPGRRDLSRMSDYHISPVWKLAMANLPARIPNDDCVLC